MQPIHVEVVVHERRPRDADDGGEQLAVRCRPAGAVRERDDVESPVRRDLLTEARIMPTWSAALSVNSGTRHRSRPCDMPGHDLQIASDLHLEFGGADVHITPHAPNLALLSDVGSPFQPHYARFLALQSARFERVFVVLGNHEYYGRHRPSEVVSRAREACRSLPNVQLLDREVYRLTSRTVLAGCTLWSDLDAQAAARLNDLRRIRAEGPSRRAPRCARVRRVAPPRSGLAGGGADRSRRRRGRRAHAPRPFSSDCRVPMRGGR